MRGLAPRNENSRAGKAALFDTPVRGGCNRRRIRRRPPAATDCVTAAGPTPLTLCSRGETRFSNRTPLVATSPYVPYDCDVDWTCCAGLGIAVDD